MRRAEHGDDHQHGKKEVLQVPRYMLLLGIAMLIGLIVFVFYHVGDTRRFLNLLVQAKPIWLITMFGLQLCTYLCVGTSWKIVMSASGYHVPIGALTRLSVEKLSIDQLVPTIGISGNLAVYQSMKHYRIPRWLALEAIMINLLSRYFAYALVTIGALVLLWLHHDITHLVIYLVSVFALILVMVPLILIWMISKKEKHLPKWLLRIKPIHRAHEVLKSVEPERIYSWKLLTYSTLLSMMVFMLDSSTLWVALKALGVAVPFYIPYISVVMAYIAATVSLLPGGLGGFEAGAVSMLVLLGLPMEAALTSTFLLRGFTLWMPMLPGLWFARRDVLLRL